MNATLQFEVNLTCYALLIVTLLGAGCASSNQSANPLAGWGLQLNEQPSPKIVNDYQAYIQGLPPKIRNAAGGPFWYFKNGTGGQAIKIEIPINNVFQEHLLIYNADGTRVKVIVYSGGRYAS
jgi:hypothetical protein